jgi:dihydrofolate reductase
MNVIVATCLTSVGGDGNDGRDGIGFNGGIPWLLPTDLKRFRSLTMGAAVVMGRRTWQSLPRKLVGRWNVVVGCSDPATWRDDAQPDAQPDAVYASLEDAWQALRGAHSVWVIGGERLYAEALAHRDTRMVYRTLVHAEKPCDRFFPRMIYMSGWHLAWLGDVCRDGMYDYHYELWKRKT